MGRVWGGLCTSLTPSLRGFAPTTGAEHPSPLNLWLRNPRSKSQNPYLLLPPFPKLQTETQVQIWTETCPRSHRRSDTDPDSNSGLWASSPGLSPASFPFELSVSLSWVTANQPLPQYTPTHPFSLLHSAHVGATSFPVPVTSIGSSWVTGHPTGLPEIPRARSWVHLGSLEGGSVGLG